SVRHRARRPLQRFRTWLRASIRRTARPEGAGGLDPRVCLKRTENADFAGESRDRGRVRRLSLVYRRLVKRIRAAPAPVSRGRQGANRAQRSGVLPRRCSAAGALLFVFLRVLGWPPPFLEGHLPRARHGEPSRGPRARAELGVLPPDEIADVHAAREGGPGAKARERADVAVGPDARAVDHAVGKDLRVGADLAVADHAAGADSYPVPERHLSLEHDV